ncbi:MAG: response regulator [Deltaproteobacteria bacterium]|nr:response regulator [Deltaproteobacteria bacterium]
MSTLRPPGSWFLLLDPATGRIQAASAALLSQLGFAREDLLGRTLEETGLFAAPAPPWEPRLAAALTAGATDLACRLVASPAKGRLELPLTATLVRLELAAGPALLWCPLPPPRPIAPPPAPTPGDQAAAAHEVLAVLAQGLAHEFNNAVSAVLGYLEIAQEELGPDQEDAAHALERSFLAGQRTQALIRQLAALATLPGSAAVALQPAVMLKEVIKRYRAAAPVSLQIRQEIFAASQFLNLDPLAFHRFLQTTLAALAGALGRAGGRLSVGLEECATAPGVPPTGPALRLSLLAAGPALDARLAPADVANGDLGACLARARNLVQALGGEARFLVHPERGVGLELVLPTSPPGDPAAAERPAAATGGQGQQIMVVDDEESLVTIACQTLANQGLAAQGFQDPREALAAFEENPDAWALVITDQTMPNLCGTDLAAHLRARRPELPLILVSGYSETLSLSEVRNQGFQAVLEKPLRPSDLARTVLQLLPRR